MTITVTLDQSGIVDTEPASAASVTVPLTEAQTLFNNILNGAQSAEALRFDELASDPATPASGKWKLYTKSGGLYLIDDTGAVIGPLGAGGGGAPTTSKYLLQQADASLPNAQAMGALGTGLVKNTTTTGAQSIATNADIPAFTGAAAGTPGSTGGVAAPAAGDQTKYLRGDNTWQAIDQIIVRDKKAANTAGGGFSSGAWRTRNLNDKPVDTGTNASITKLAFTSGGTYVIVAGNTITGATSGATATVFEVVITSGSFAGGDAAGDLWLNSQTGTFQSENLNVGANSNVATIAANSVNNQVRLKAGTYAAEISCPAYLVDIHKSQLYNITASAIVADGEGTSEYAGAAGAVQTRSVIECRFTLASAATLEVQHQCQTTRNTNGLGIASNMGISEVYTVAKFWKVG